MRPSVEYTANECTLCFHTQFLKVASNVKMKKTNFVSVCLAQIVNLQATETSLSTYSILWLDALTILSVGHKSVAVYCDHQSKWRHFHSMIEPTAAFVWTYQFSDFSISRDWTQLICVLAHRRICVMHLFQSHAFDNQLRPLFANVKTYSVTPTLLSILARMY